MENFKLGRKAIVTDSRTLKFAKYATAAMPNPPTAADWTDGITDFGMMLNDTLGDCTIAGVGHAIQVWTANCYSESTVPDSAILKAYEDWDGYNPADPSSDQGGIELDVLKAFKKYGLAGHHMIGFADPNPKNHKEIQQSIAYFGGVYIGMEVPNFIMGNIPERWDVTANDGGIDGGHCVYVCGYDAETFTFISWGKLYRMTLAYWDKYVDEAHTIFGCGWVKSGKTPSGFNVAQLNADLATIR